MPQTSTLVATPRASRYLQQLCKHWAHHFEASFDANAGKVAFGSFGQAEFQPTPEQLSILITATDEHLEETRRIVEDHLRRFAHDEVLQIEWMVTEAR